MSFKIIGDSCCDYPYLVEDFDWLVRVPLTIDLQENTYIDDDKLRCTELLAQMASSIHAPKSACPSPGSFLEAYEECDADDIYVVTLSDKVSGTYNSAVVAASMFKKNYPERNIFVFSSRSAASGEISVCEKLYELASSGMAFDEVVEYTLRHIDNMHTFFVLENLDVLRKNGRLNHLQALITGALKLKLVMGADENGSICLRGKALTMDRALKKMADMIRDSVKDKDVSKRKLYITQCQCPDRARKVRDMILERVPFMDSLILRSGGISTIYANAGGLVVCY